MDKEEVKASGSGAAATGGVSAARELFRNKTVRGQDIKNDTDTLKTLHERPITLIQDATPVWKTKAGQKAVYTISTSSLDGKLLVWDLPTLEIDMAALGV